MDGGRGKCSRPGGGAGGTHDIKNDKERQLETDT